MPTAVVLAGLALTGCGHKSASASDEICLSIQLHNQDNTQLTATLGISPTDKGITFDGVSYVFDNSSYMYPDDLGKATKEVTKITKNGIASVAITMPFQRGKPSSQENVLDGIIYFNAAPQRAFEINMPVQLAIPGSNQDYFNT